MDGVNLRGKTLWLPENLCFCAVNALCVFCSDCRRLFKDVKEILEVSSIFFSPLRISLQMFFNPDWAKVSKRWTLRPPFRDFSSVRCWKTSAKKSRTHFSLILWRNISIKAVFTSQLSGSWQVNYDLIGETHIRWCNNSKLRIYAQRCDLNDLRRCPLIS